MKPVSKCIWTTVLVLYVNSILKKYDWKGCRYMYVLIGCNKVDNKSLKYVFGASLKYLVLNELFNHNI